MHTYCSGSTYNLTCSPALRILRVPVLRVRVGHVMAPLCQYHGKIATDGFTRVNVNVCVCVRPDLSERRSKQA